MEDQDKTKEQLISELAELRQRIAESETAEAERKRAEELLQESEAKWRSLVENSPDVIFTVARDGTILTINRMVTPDAAPEQAIGRKVYDFISPEHTGKMKENIERVFQTEKPYSYEEKGPGPQGPETAWYDVRLIPIWDDKQVTSVMQISRDITNRKQVEEELRESEELYRNLVETSPTAIVTGDIQGNLLFVSSYLAEMHGYESADQLLSEIKNIRELVAPESQTLLEKEFKNVLESGYSQTREYALPKKGGKEFPAMVSATAIRDSEGKPSGFMAVALDITERKRAEEELRRLKEFNESIVQSLAEGVVVIDAEGYFTFVNPAQAALLGYTPEELIGQHWMTIVPPDQQPIVHEAGERRTREKVGRYELELVHKDGTRISVLVSGSPRFEEGHFVGFLVVFTDITELKRAGEALQESEGKYRTLVEQSLQGLVIVQNFRIVFANTAFATISGYTVEELLSLEPEEVIASTHPEDQEIVWGNFRDRLMGKPASPRYEYRGIQKGGAVRWVEMSANRIEYRGKPAVQATIVDITDRKRAEAERERLLAQIQEQVRQVQQIVDTVPEGVLLLDADGRVVLANPVAEKDLAVLAGAKVGDTITYLGDRPLTELLTSPPIKGLWHEVAAGDRVFEVIARPMENGPEPEDWVLIINDVSQEREIQRHIQQQERLAAVGQLAAGIAHDFNNIMAVISLYADMSLRTPGLPAKMYERLETMNQQARRATDLIQQILDFSRRAILERRPMNLLVFLKEQVRLLERALPESIQMDLAYDRDEYMVNADPTRMQQAIMNLALNARDAMPEGGQLRISLAQIQIEDRRAARLPEMESGEWVQVTVSDTGVGISPDDLPHVFDPFFSTKAPGEGSGLGLAQVHGIVGQHEGHIDVESQPGQGTTFTIYLPALPVHPQEPLALEKLALVKGRGEIILVVEDDVVVRETMVDSLELLNYRVLEAANGQEALALLEQRGDEIALVLSDVVMPEMGGVALLHALRERGLEVGMVLMTGHSLERKMESLRAQGMIDWLPKPPDLEQLAKVVGRALNRD